MQKVLVLALGVLIEHIHFRVVLIVASGLLILTNDVIALDGGVLACLSDGIRLEEVDRDEGDSEEEGNEDQYFETLLEVVSVIIVAVLPDDVSRLGGFDKLEGLIEEQRNFFLFHVLILVSNNHAVLLLESNEGIDGSDEFAPVSVLELNDLLLDLAGLIIAIKHDVLTALLQEGDHLGIIKGEDDVGDQNLLNVNATIFGNEFLLTLLGLHFSSLIFSLKCLQLICENGLQLLLHVDLE